MRSFRASVAPTPPSRSPRRLFCRVPLAYHCLPVSLLPSSAQQIEPFKFFISGARIFERCMRSQRCNSRAAAAAEADLDTLQARGAVSGSSSTRLEADGMPDRDIDRGAGPGTRQRMHQTETSVYDALWNIEDEKTVRWRTLDLRRQSSERSVRSRRFLRSGRAGSSGSSGRHSSCAHVADGVRTRCEQILVPNHGDGL